MATQATIIIHIPNGDIGRFKKCNPDKINLRTTQMFIDSYKKLFGPVKGVEIARKYLEGGYDKIPDKKILSSKLKKVKLGEYMEIYHHWDGYPEALGKELLKNYNTYEKVLNLILAGDFSTIMDGSVPYAGLEELSWKACKPNKYDYLPPCECYYQYIFNPIINAWFYRTFYDETLRRLK